MAALTGTKLKDTQHKINTGKKKAIKRFDTIVNDDSDIIYP
jgi:hypothetical protein